MLRRVFERVRRRPRTYLLIGVLLAVASIAGASYLYALGQWRAAQTALQDDRPQEARSRLEFCLFLWPRSTSVHLLAARAERLCGDLEAAERHLKRCMRLQGGPSEATRLEFYLMRAQWGEVDEVAAVLFSDYIDNHHPETQLILETIARAYMHQLRYGPAYDCLGRWIQEAPHSPKPYHWRGWVLERINQPGEAMQDYGKALELDPDLYAVRLRVAEMLIEDNKYDEAFPHLNYLRARYPDRPELLARLGQCYFQKGEFQEARKSLEAAVEKLPADTSVLLYLARLELQEKQPIQAEKWLRRVLEIDPADTEALYGLFSALKAQGRPESAAALEKYQKTKELVDRANLLLRTEAEHPTTGPDVPAEIGSLLLRIGQERLGVYWLEQALVRDPDHRLAHKELAEHFEKKGDSEKAASHRRFLVGTPRGSSP